MAKNRIADKLNNANTDLSAQASMTVIDRLQVRFQPGEQVVGVCATFLLLCEHYGVPAQDAMTVTKNMINDANGRYVPEFRAVKQYVQEELP